MPSRQMIRRLPSVDVQGLDSWVSVTKTTFGEAEQLKALAKAAQDAGQPLDDMDVFKDMAIKHIKDWNWVDEDGQPLPLPSKDPSVIQGMTDDEVTFIRKAIQGPGADDLKN